MSILSFHRRLLTLALLLTPAVSSAQSTITFLDADGEPVAEYLESSVVFVRVEDPFGVGLSFINVNVSSTLADDLEFVDLFEGETPGVFEGRVDLDPDGVPTQGDQRLQTSIDLGPPVVHETVTVDYGGVSMASITLRGARVELVGDLGHPTQAYAVGAPIFVRVTDYRAGDPVFEDSFPLDVFLVSDPAVRETAVMTETGEATGVFEGRVDNGPSSPWAGVNEEIRVEYADADGLVASDSAFVQASVVSLVDAAGRPVDAYREGSRAFVRVIDPAANYSPDYMNFASVGIESLQGNDFEYVGLVETGNDTSIFEGEIDLGVGTNQQNRLETLRLPGSPPFFDTILVDYFDGVGGSSDSAGTVGASVAFVDEAGRATGRYARDTTARIRLEGVNLVDGRETAQVTVTSTSGDSETVTLRETGLGNGVFEGTIGIRDPFWGGPDASWIQAAPSDTLTVSFQDGDLTPAASALVESFGLDFVDEEGRPLDQVLENGFVRVRLTGLDFPPSWVDFVSLEGQDWESSQWRPTGPRTSEATIDLERGVAQNFGLLEAWQSDAPPTIPDDVAAFTFSGNESGTRARIRSSRLTLLDIFGREAANEYMAGDDVRVRVEDYSLDMDPLVRETVSVTVRATSGDTETLQLLETDFASAVFEGTLPGQIDPSGAGDGVIGYLGGLLEVAYPHLGGAAESTVRVRVRESLVYMVGEDGMPAETFLQGGEAQIMLVQKLHKDPLTIDTDAINVYTDLGGDEENFLVTETGLDTNVFTATVPLVLQPGGATTFNGVVEVSESAGQADVAIARHFEDCTEVRDARFEAVGSTLSFIDETGLDTDVVAAGSTLYLRLADPSSNEAGQVDTVSVTVQSLATGDSETLTLTETDPESGVFEGSAVVDVAAAQPEDGAVQVLDLEHLEASYTNPSGLTSSTDRAEIVKILVRIVDDEGRKADTVLEDGPLRLRVWDFEANWDPGAPDVLSATAETFFGFGEEFITLTETGNDTGIFEGVKEDGVFSLNGGPPHYPLDKVVAGYTWNDVFYSDSARIVEAAVDFVDLFGEPVDLYAVRSEVRVVIHAPNRNDPFFADSFPVTFSSPTGSSETVMVVETGVDTGIYEGGVATSEDPIVPGELWVEAGQSVEISFPNKHASSTFRHGIPFSSNVVPYLMDDMAVTQKDQAVTVEVLANDEEQDGQPMFLVAVTQGANGSVAVNPDDTVTYTPAAGFVGADAFEYFVEDSEGGQARATVSVQVQSPPTVTITAPADGSAVDQGDPVAFTGTATDPEDGDLAAALVWSSDLDGAIDTGASFVTSGLSPGVHLITASVTDSDGNPASDSITLTVSGLPTVAITSPMDGLVVDGGDNVTFTGTASDPEDGDLSVSIAWSSDVDGALGTGTAISTSSLSLGVHVITASVIDSQGNPASDTVSVTVNGLPTVAITSPADGVVVDDGADVTFTGTAADPEDGDLSASIAWSSDVDGALGTGASISTSALSVGVHVITATVTDSQGTPASDTVSVTVNGLPTAAITAPANGLVVDDGVNVTFTGTASDPEDGDLSASIAWASDVDGALGTGASISTSALSVGVHVITAAVTDSAGTPASDTVSVTVNGLPTVAITSPADGSVVDDGANVTFTGTASDPEDGDLAASIAWASSLDGALGTGASISTSSLSVGVHVITASVTDSAGSPASDTVSVTVNGLPTVTITAPADGVVVDDGDNVTFTGTTSDPEDGDLAASIAWASSLDGALGTGASISTSSLSVGVHVITASVTDGAGSPASDTVSVTVNGLPTVAITAPADGTVVNDGANVTFTGTASDPEDGDLAASIAWASSLDGALGTGASVPTTGLSVGVHVITVAVADSRGVPASDTITVTVNGLPTAAITAPAGGGVFLQGASVGFAGTAGDPEDGDLTSSLVWTSSLDGTIGTGGSFSTSGLSLGVHVITVAVADSRGVPASDAVTVTINAAPVVTVVAPADGSIVALGDSVTFSGSAVDVEDGDLGANLTWTSDLDGTIGAGGSFSTTALSGGTHLVTASVTDSLGAPAADAVTVIVKVPIQVTFTSNGAEDGWVLESSETSGVGGQVADTGNGPTGDNGIRGGDDKKDKQYRGFLSFDTSAIPAGATIRSATLRLRRQTVNGTSPFATHGNLAVDVRTGAFGGSATLEASDFEAAATASGVAVMGDAPADEDWSEGAFDASGLAALNPAGITQVRIAFDLDDDDNRSNDFVEFYPGDHGTAANRPQLVVEYLD